MMAHAQKIKKSGVIGMVIHCERRAGCQLSNQDIDESRTHLNYNLAKDIQPLIPEKFLKQRINEVKHLKRDDIVYMVDWIVTLPKDVLKEDTERFFEYTYQFLEQKYKKENVVSAWVHMDETTPHIHFSFIPIIEINGIERLKCKDILTKQELKRFHPDLSDYIEQRLGYMPSIQNNATINGNRTIKELKNQEDLSLKKSLDNVNKHIKASNEIITKSQNIDYDPDGLLEKTRTLKKCNQIIDELKHNNKELSADNNSLSKLVITQKNELNAYRNMPLARQLKEKEQVINNLYSSIHQLENYIHDMEYDNQTLKKYNNKLESKIDKTNKELLLFKTFVSWLGLDKLFQKFKNTLLHNDYEIDIKSFKELSSIAIQKISNTIDKLSYKMNFLEKETLSVDETITQKNNNQTMKNIIR